MVVEFRFVWRGREYLFWVSDVKWERNFLVVLREVRNLSFSVKLFDF